MSHYEQVKAQDAEFQERFYSLLESSDDYAELLRALADEEERRSDGNSEVVRRLRHQEQKVRDFENVLEGPAMEVFIRLIDRVKMIDIAESGDFV